MEDGDEVLIHFGGVSLARLCIHQRRCLLAQPTSPPPKPGALTAPRTAAPTPNTQSIPNSKVRSHASVALVLPNHYNDPDLV